MNSRLRTNKQKLKSKPELNTTKPYLPPNLQPSKQDLLFEIGFMVYK